MARKPRKKRPAEALGSDKFNQGPVTILYVPPAVRDLFTAEQLAAADEALRLVQAERVAKGLPPLRVGAYEQQAEAGLGGGERP